MHVTKLINLTHSYLFNNDLQHMVRYITIINSNISAFACYEILVYWWSQKGESISALDDGHGHKLTKATQVTNLQNIDRYYTGKGWNAEKNWDITWDYFQVTGN